MEYVIEAEYMVTKVMVVEVPDGLDPKDPKNWGQIIQEDESDSSLWDVTSAEENV